MSDETDLDRDLRLAEALGRLPAPALPAGLAERIVRNATALPQESGPAEAPIAAPEMQRGGRRRWLPYAVGSAIAASLAAALLLQVPAETPRPSDTQTAQISTPLPAPEARLPMPSPHAATRDERMAIAEDRTASSPPRKAAADKRTDPQDDDAPRVTPVEEAPVMLPTPALAEQDGPTTPTAPASEQALVGPPVPLDLDPAMPPGTSPPGFGIAGGGAAPPASAAPSPQPRGGGSGGMPRF